MAAANAAIMIRHAAPGRSCSNAFGAGVVALAALVAAAIAHVAIDAAGDFVLAHDSYDHIAHHSRFIALLFAGVAAASTLLVLVAAALRDARTDGAALARLVSSCAHRSRWLFIGGVALASLAALVGMESIDGWLDVGRLPTFADALGGSLVLGLGVVALSAWVIGEAAWRVLRFVNASHAAISKTLYRLLTMRDAAGVPQPTPHASVRTDRAAPRGSVLASRAGKRAPPLFA